jgi:hypothetical protein
MLGVYDTDVGWGNLGKALFHRFRTSELGACQHHADKIVDYGYPPLAHPCRNSYFGQTKVHSKTDPFQITSVKVAYNIARRTGNCQIHYFEIPSHYGRRVLDQLSRQSLLPSLHGQIARKTRPACDS